MQPFSLLRLNLLSLTVAVLLSAGAAVAAPHKLLVCYPNGAGSTAEAAPQLEKFFRQAEKLAGWPAQTLSGAYMVTADTCEAYLRDHKPDLALLSLPFFLANRARLQATPLLEVVPRHGEPEVMHVVATNGATALAELRGKRLTGDMLDDLRFVSRIVFDGTLDAKQAFTVVPVRTALKAIKDVHRGGADAALLDHQSFLELKNLPFGSAFKQVYATPTLPGWPLVALGPGLSAADRRTLAAQWPKVCDGAEGAENCKQMRIGGLKAASDRTYEALVRKYGP